MGARLAPWGVTMAAAAWSAAIFAVLTHLVATAPWPAVMPPEAELVRNSLLVGLAALVAAGLASAAIRCSGVGGALGPAAAWVLGTLAIHRTLHWEVVPPRIRFLEVGPALGLWLGVGTLVLLGCRRWGAGSALWSVPARTLIAWSIPYGLLWTAILVAEGAGRQRVPGLLAAAVLVVAVAALSVTFAAAAAFVGPSEPVPQLLALAVAGVALTVSNPIAFELLGNVRTLDADERVALFAMALPASIGVILGAAMIWLRARHHRRQTAP
jgi:hypothetical protein